MAGLLLTRRSAALIAVVVCLDAGWHGRRLHAFSAGIVLARERAAHSRGESFICRRVQNLALLQERQAFLDAFRRENKFSHLNAHKKAGSPAGRTPNSELSVIPSGFEPETHSLEGCCSIQLSYGTSPAIIQMN